MPVLPTDAPGALGRPASDTSDRHPASHRHRARQFRALAVISAGGALGAAGRYGAQLLEPVTAGHFPWTTFAVNVVGCALIGVLMVLISEVWAAQPLLRPFLGTGVLGGFTTFSTYAVEAHTLITDGHLATGLYYLIGTVFGALGAVWAAARLTQWVVTRKERSCS